jgi:multiple sugar transport system permease protein
VRRDFGRRLLSPLGVVLTCFYLFPIYWMVITAFKRPADIFAIPPDIVPVSPTLQGFNDAVIGNEAVFQGIVNSLVIGSGSLVITLALGAPAAYGLARLRLRFTGLIILVMLGAQMLPTINLALPMFAIFSRLRLVDTYFALIVANVSLTLPFAIIIMRPYFLSVPRELIEAAMIDGCSPFGAFRRIVLPLVRPGVVVTGALTFLTAWGEFVFGLTLATSDEMQPITVVLNRFIAQYGTRWNELMAVSTIIALPIVLTFLLAQKHLVEGLTAGATKE